MWPWLQQLSVGPMAVHRAVQVRCNFAFFCEAVIKRLNKSIQFFCFLDTSVSDTQCLSRKERIKKEKWVVFLLYIVLYSNFVCVWCGDNVSLKNESEFWEICGIYLLKEFFGLNILLPVFNNSVHVFDININEFMMWKQFVDNQPHQWIFHGPPHTRVRVVRLCRGNLGGKTNI